MSVRLAGRSDVEAVAGLVLAFRDHLGSARPHDSEADALVATALADPATEFCLAASDDGTPLGYGMCRFFVSIWASGSEAHLEDLFVVEPARGRGIGRRLLEFTLERAVARGALGIGLHTNEHNRRAHGLYRAFGFAPQTEPRWEGGREILWRRSLRDE